MQKQNIAARLFPHPFHVDLRVSPVAVAHQLLVQARGVLGEAVEGIGPVLVGVVRPLSR